MFLDGGRLLFAAAFFALCGGYVNIWENNLQIFPFYAILKTENKFAELVDFLIHLYYLTSVVSLKT